MRVFQKGDKLAVAAHRLKRTRVYDLPEILTKVIPSGVEEEYYIEIHNLSIIEVLNDPYMNFKAIDQAGNLWYGLIHDKRDKLINISNLTVALPACLYNPNTENLEKNSYFDVSAVLHNLKKNMDNETAPVKAESCRALYLKIKTAFSQL